MNRGLSIASGLGPKQQKTAGHEARR